jgi:hypothetical protein
MTKALVIVALAAGLVACSQPAPPQSAAGGQETSSASPAAQPQPGDTSPAAPASSTPAAAPRASELREVTIPAGTSLSVTLSSALASNTSKVEDPVRGTVAKSVVVSGTTAVPQGSEISGSVLDVKESGRVKGRASIAFRFDRLVVNGESYRIQTARVMREAARDTGGDVKKGAIGGGIGAVVGGIVGGGKGAAIGAAAGGTGTVLATKGKEVQLAAGTVVTVPLQDSLTVQAPIR